MTTPSSARLRQQVTERANNCCEYCRVSQEDIFFRFELDPIIAEEHGSVSVENNLGLSCPECNAGKGSDISALDFETGKFTPLYNPRQQRWADHFRLNDAKIEPLTPEGRVTVFLLRLNHLDRITDRQLLLQEDRYPCRQDT